MERSNGYCERSADVLETEQEVAREKHLIFAIGHAAAAAQIKVDQ